MTDQYAVIGNPISHSKSPLIHRMFAEQTGEDISYEAIEAPLDGFTATIERLRAEGYKGCNVTVPFKFEAYDLVSKLKDSTLPLQGTCNQAAINAHAVNTLKFETNFIESYNTDGAGLVTDIERNLGIALHNKRVLLMGAGGAASGVLQPLLHTKPSHLVIANRTQEKADALHRLYAHLSGTEILAKTYDELDGLQFDVVINATSAGLSDSAIPLPATIFAPGALAYDMMYGRETPFMTFAREHGAQVSDGLGMLVEQAAEAFHIWRGVRPDTRPVLEKFRAT